MKFFDYLNSRHPNIKFTFEKQNGGKLAFLDILISNESDNFCTSVFRKKTSIGLYTNFTSFTPFSYKIGLIKTLLHRAFEISSSWNFFDQEKEKIKNLLMKNLYPSYLTISYHVSVKCRYFRLQHFRVFTSFLLLVAIQFIIQTRSF